MISAYAGSFTDPGLGGVGDSAWTNPGSALGAPDAAVATATADGLTLNGITDFLDLTNFGLSVDSVAGIAVAITGFSSGTLCNWQAQLVYAGALVGALRSIAVPTSSSTVTLGGSADVWGTSLTPAQIASSSFGVEIVGTAQASRTLSLDAVQIAIYGSPSIQKIYKASFPKRLLRV